MINNLLPREAFILFNGNCRSEEILHDRGDGKGGGDNEILPWMFFKVSDVLIMTNIWIYDIGVFIKKHPI